MIDDYAGPTIRIFDSGFGLSQAAKHNIVRT